MIQQFPRIFTFVASVLLGLGVLALSSDPSHAGGKKRKWNPNASPDVIFQPPAPPPAGSCGSNGIRLDSSCCTGGQAVGGTPAPGCPSLDPSAKTTIDTIQEFAQASSTGQNSLSAAGSYNGSGLPTGNMANPNLASATSNGVLTGSSLLKNVSASGGSSPGSSSSTSGSASAGAGSQGTGAGGGAGGGAGNGSAAGGAYSGGAGAGLGALGSTSSADGTKGAVQVSPEKTANAGGAFTGAGGVRGSGDSGDDGLENSATLDPHSAHDGDQLGGRGLASSPSGSEDPSDYFRRLKKDESIFKVVERRYQTKAGQWAKGMATGLTEEAKKYLK